ncbi:hypothetical protein TWF696_001125 [Orbilia brochopaga]|uniref:Uncharacterized protein n=1 Tax=Orbilia brochopaga TaxID=3140254 RepID=A0AAV9VFT2_9PEZI
MSSPTSTAPALAPAPTSVTASGGQPGSDSDNVSDSLVALLALVFAAIAFIIAFLQVLLQYLTSNQRDKCLSGAVGVWSRLTKTGWDFGRWRIRVHYPQIQFDPDVLLEHRDPRNAVDTWKEKYFPNHDSRSRRQLVKDGIIQPGVRKWYIGDGGGYIIKEGFRPITFWDLSIIQKFTWLWLRLWNRFDGELYFAKAGWANVLATLSIAVTDRIVQEYEDADKIPTGVDVPVQRIQLAHLSLLCYMINIKNIELKPEEGSIEAHNAFVRVSTQPIPGLGQVVVIDGDFGSLHDEIWPLDTSTIRSVYSIARGDILGIARFNANIEYLDTDAFLHGLLKNWDQDTWTMHEEVSASHRFVNVNDPMGYAAYLRVSPRRQAAYYSESMPNYTPYLSDPWSTIWSKSMGFLTPTIIQYLGIMPFIGLWCAAPLDLFIAPYSPYLKRSREAWYQDQRDNNGLSFVSNPQMEADLPYGSIPFLKADSEFELITNPIATVSDIFTWVGFPLINILQWWDSDIAKDVVSELELENPVLTFPASVIHLLNGGSVDDIRQIMRDSRPLGKNFTYVLESTIILSLIMVDCRLQALWALLDKDSSLGKIYRTVRTNKIEPTDFKSLGDLIEASRFCLTVRGDYSIDPTLVHFTRLWFELGRRADLTGETSRLQRQLTDILDEWQSDDGYCIPGIPRVDLSQQNQYFKYNQDFKPEDYAKEFVPSPDSMTKRNFANWLKGDFELEDGSSGGTRVEVVRKMIPLLQLRTFLMGLSYDCYADSSKVYLVGAAATVNVRLV